MKRWQKIMLIVCVVLLILLFAALAVAGNFLFGFALDPEASYTMSDLFQTGNVIGIGDGPEVALSPERQAWHDYAAEAAAWYQENRQPVELARPDGTRRGSLFPQEGHRYAVVFHGYTNTSDSMSAYAKAYYDMGFTVLTPDALAHGASDGRYIGMGWLERPDVLGWLEQLTARDPDAEIVLHGVSMGGATVMMAAGEALPDNVKCIVEDCGYASVWDEFRLQLKNVFGLPTFPLLHAASAVSKLRAGYSFGEASAVNQLRKASVPMLFIHGEADTFVPYEMLDMVYDACASEVKERLSVPNAAHGASADTDPALYWHTVADFVGRFVSE